MKNVKLFSKFMIIAATIVAVSIAGCKKDDDEDPVNKAALQTKIEQAETILNAAVEGTAQGQYLYGSKAEFLAKIDLAKAVNTNADATQVQVDNAIIALDQAITEFDAKKVTPIAPENLVGHWTFDEGTGTTLNDFSGNAYNGTLMSGANTWGGGLPVWTTDRYGNVGKALMFNQGAYVSIPQNLAFSPQNISISLWVNAAEILENNRFIGLHSWNGYKFQLQSINKSFFTLATTEGIYDRDTDPPLEVNEWYHLAVTFGGGNMTFYVDGTQTQVWDNTPGTAVSVSGNDLVFGRDTDVYAPDASNYDNDLIIPLDWGGYFHGKMDEVRIYKTVLSPAQIQAIYDLEKP